MASSTPNEKIKKDVKKQHELEACADILGNVNKNLRIASSHLDLLIGTVSETNKIADGWVNIWRKMHDKNVDKKNSDNKEVDVNNYNDKSVSSADSRSSNVGKRKKNNQVVNNSRSVSTTKRFKNK